MNTHTSEDKQVVNFPEEQNKRKALVLLGLRNSGKDTMFRALKELMPSAVNIKFSSFHKHLLGELMGIPQYVLENKTLRESLKLAFEGGDVTFEYQSDVSMLDLLNALFIGSAEVASLRKAHIEYAMLQFTESDFPVFTDIRRHSELAAVKHLNPLVVHVRSPHEVETLADLEVKQLFNSVPVERKLMINTSDPAKAASYVHAFIG
jgi:energy-coupling factor transporter ATP-binding protein EcfA2